MHERVLDEELMELEYQDLRVERIKVFFLLCIGWIYLVCNSY